MILCIEYFAVYFKFIGESMNRAVANYQAQSGDYIRDAAMLKNELKREGVDLDTLRDPWGTPYQVRLRKIPTNLV